MLLDIDFCPYKVLQISRDAEPELIKAAHRTFAGKYHPDRYLASDGFTEKDRQQASERFNKVTLAYEILSHPVKRAEYEVSHPEATDYDDPESEPDFTDDWGAEANESEFEEQIYVKVAEPNHAPPVDYAAEAARAKRLAAEEAKWRASAERAAYDAANPPPQIWITILVTALMLAIIPFLDYLNPSLSRVQPLMILIVLVVAGYLIKKKVYWLIRHTGNKVLSSKLLWTMFFLAGPITFLGWLGFSQGSWPPAIVFTIPVIVVTVHGVNRGLERARTAY